MSDQTSDIVQRAREAMERLRPYSPDERRDLTAALDRMEALERCQVDGLGGRVDS